MKKYNEIQFAANKIDAEENLSRRTMQIITNENLHFHPYCKNFFFFQNFRKPQEIKRLQHSKELLRLYVIVVCQLKY